MKQPARGKELKFQEDLNEMLGKNSHGSSD